MYKKILLLFLTALTPFISHAATTRPIVSLAYGVDYIHLPSLQKDISLEAPFQDTYISPSQTLHGPVVGIFLGLESALPWDLLGQVGLGYYRPQILTVQGTILQFGNPDYNNKSYQENIQTQQALIEFKLLSTIQTRFPLHPYIVAGVGESINKSYGYTETPLAPYVVVNTDTFANRTLHSFIYTVGLGIDVDVTAHVRLGVGYRQIELGAAKLGTMPNQADTNVLSYNTLQTSEILFNFTYVG